VDDGATACRLDVTDPESIEACISTIEERFGRLDVVVNNARSREAAGAPAPPTWTSTRCATPLETNLFGAWKLTQAALPLMRRNGYGRIVNLPSGMDQLSDMRGHAPAYRISKTGLNALTRMLSAELAGENILVNSCCPGWVRTDMGGTNARPSVDEAGTAGDTARPGPAGRVLPGPRADSLVAAKSSFQNGARCTALILDRALSRRCDCVC
jgi:NAD(P)-dependent dehydrogenase (short-subunit alcohol dehydrogenase family)